MPLVLDATTLRALARALRILALRHRADIQKHGEGSVSARHAREYAELYERRAQILEDFAGTGQEFEIRRR